MNRFFLFFQKVYLFVIFVLIELGAILYFSLSSIYTNANVINASDYLIRGVSGIINRSNEYIHVFEENRELIKEIASLNNEIERYKKVASLYDDTLFYKNIDTTGLNIHSYFNAEVVRNNISKQHNFITISKGKADGIEPNMALINHGSIVGYVVDCSDNYSIAISILNCDFKTSGRDINNNYFGSIRWKGETYREVELREIPKYSTVNIGDTIVTTQYSSRFPSGIKIGTVKEVELKEGMNYSAKIELFQDMSKLFNVMVIKNRDINERLELEGGVEDS